MNIITAIQDSNDSRIVLAQRLCLASLSRFELNIITIPGNPRPLFNKMLEQASKSGEWFGWVNSDCQLLLSPDHIIANKYDVIGLRRIEIGTGEKCGGVDGYFIKKSFWDLLAKDAPDMYVGGTHIDWWITRATQKFGKYTEGFYLAHIPHQRTEASCGIDNYGKWNLQKYNEWSDRNRVSKC